MLTEPGRALSAQERMQPERAFRMRGLPFAWLVLAGGAPPMVALLVYLYFRFGPQNFPTMLGLVVFSALVMFPGLGLWYRRYPAVVITGEGLWGRDLWGRMRFSPWEGSRAPRPSRFLGIAMIRVPVPNSRSSAWVPRWVVQQPALERALARLSPLGHPIRARFGVDERASAEPESEDPAEPPPPSAAVAGSAIAVNLLLYGWVLFLSAASYLGRHGGSTGAIAESRPHLFFLDLLYSFGPALAALVGGAALIWRPWWAPLLVLSVNSALALHLGAGAAIVLVASRGAGVEAVIPAPLIVAAVLVVLGSALVCSPAAQGGFESGRSSP